MAQYVVVNGNGMAVTFAEDSEVLTIPDGVDVGQYAVEDDIDALRELATDRVTVGSIFGLYRTIANDAR